MVIRSSDRKRNYDLIVVSLVGLLVVLNFVHQTKSPTIGTTMVGRGTVTANTSITHELNGGDHRNRNKKDFIDQPRECTWAPDQSSDCREMISGLIEKPGSTTPAIGRRFLFIGDSTMGPACLAKNLLGQLVVVPFWDITERFCKGRYQCEIYEGRRCHSNHVFHLDYPKNMEWRRPGIGIGPKSRHPFCTQCTVCPSSFLQCNITNGSHPCIENTPALIYGGYMAVEFSKDMEMQSPEYLTTQENTIHYIRREWNTPELVHDFGKPICFVNAGHHDVNLPGTTRDIYLENVQWYLDLLRTACSQVFWISTNAPLQEESTPGGHPQTVNGTRYWNDGVRQLILTSDEYQSDASVAYIDIWEASRSMPHHDNVHMGPQYYSSLASLFMDVPTSFR